MTEGVEVLEEVGNLPAVRVEESPQKQLELVDITAATLSKHLYSFKPPGGGESIVGLTVDGINHIASRMGVTTETVEIIAEDENSITVKAVARKGNIRHVGIVREPKRTKGGKENQFAYQKAVSKAQRNAKKGLLPMPWIKAMIEQVTGGKGVVENDLELAEELDSANQRLENARAHYLEQKQVIEGQSSQLEGNAREIADLKQQVEDLMTAMGESSAPDAAVGSEASVPRPGAGSDGDAGADDAPEINFGN